MLEVMSESAGNVLGIRARGALTNDDYQRVLVPRLESMLKHTNTIRVLFCMDETFQGWSAKAAWANMPRRSPPKTLRENRDRRRQNVGRVVRETRT
jgi:hypothetical protein